MTPIQFGHITIAETTYPVKFGMSQSREYCKVLGCELKDYDSLLRTDADGKNRLTKLETNGDEMLAMVWSALKDGARVEKQEFTMALEDAGDIIDYMNRHTELWKQFFAIMQDGMQEQASPNGKATPKAKSPEPVLN